MESSGLNSGWVPQMLKTSVNDPSFLNKGADMEQPETFEQHQRRAFDKGHKPSKSWDEASEEEREHWKRTGELARKGAYGDDGEHWNLMQESDLQSNRAGEDLAKGMSSEDLRTPPYWKEHPEAMRNVMNNRNEIARENMRKGARPEVVVDVEEDEDGVMRSEEDRRHHKRDVNRAINRTDKKANLQQGVLNSIAGMTRMGSLQSVMQDEGDVIRKGSASQGWNQTSTLRDICQSCHLDPCECHKHQEATCQIYLLPQNVLSARKE